MNTGESWATLQREQPDFARRVRATLDLNAHKVLATIRADGAPRLCGQEIFFVQDDVWLGLMPGSRRGDDLRRDPRCELHSAVQAGARDDPESWAGDARLTGTATPEARPDVVAQVLGELGALHESKDGAVDDDQLDTEMLGDFDLFRLALTRVVNVWVEGDHMTIATWRPGEGVHEVRR